VAHGVNGMSIVKDPVCGVSLDEKTAIYKSIHGNRIYYFHSSGCQAEFVRDPTRYASQAGESRHVTHYGGYCGVQGCGKPSRGLVWYMYVALLLLVLLLFLVVR